MRWFEQYRMEWIAETLRVFGFINREHIKRKFGISTPQASTDINRFLKLYPGTMAYNKTTKRYVAVRSPAPPLFAAPVPAEQRDER